jgi:hypothetical protein
MTALLNKKELRRSVLARVTRLVEFLPFGRIFAFWANFRLLGQLFSLGIFLKNTEIAQNLGLLFSTSKIVD